MRWAFPPADIAAGLESFKPAAMRMEVRRRPDGVIIVNDAYNANPSSMHASIESFCRSYPDQSALARSGRHAGTGRRRPAGTRRAWAGGSSRRRWSAFFSTAATRVISFKACRTHKFRGVVERYRKKRYLIEAMGASLKTERASPPSFLKRREVMKLEQVSHALLSLPS